MLPPSLISIPPLPSNFMVLQEQVFQVMFYSIKIQYFLPVSQIQLSTCANSYSKMTLIYKLFIPSTLVASRHYRNTCYSFPKICSSSNVSSASEQHYTQLFWFCMPNKHPLSLIYHKVPLI